MRREPWHRILASVVGAVACAVLLVGVAGCGDESSSATGSEPSASPSPSASSAASSSAAPTESSWIEPTASPTLDPVHVPPYIDHVQWVQTQVGPSLQIYPTPSGRKTTSDNGADVAWAEVLALAPNADTPGMRAQFDCHWTYARIVAPDKPSWNIEPDRSVVSQQEMINTMCNPGGPEE
ncbi:DUF2599 domain-containing protein [Gordonia polyisoprenivorans]|uniref:DUF2599 domain-containing protein n=1 Tax=Gordonia polyisoprenivorans TaxID=84595 RepID=UPI001AD6D006|nr:DUF2599 domain-containing protein [Gordonia polyisoprenivorans]QTI70405.1 DUF2599 domain-containing protein [Gordonia polyisoprenivorans]